LAVTVAFFLCFLLRLPDSQRLATVTVAIIMLIGADRRPWVIALHRFIEVSLRDSDRAGGFLDAVAESRAPKSAGGTGRRGVETGRFIPSRHGRRSAAAGSLEDLNAQVSDAFRKNAALLENALQEAFGSMRDRESLALLAAQVERIRLAVEIGGSCAAGWRGGHLSAKFDPEWSKCAPMPRRLSDRSPAVSGPVSWNRSGRI
jgi:hypothetical protein